MVPLLCFFLFFFFWTLKRRSASRHFFCQTCGQSCKKKLLIFFILLLVFFSPLLFFFFSFFSFFFFSFFFSSSLSLPLFFCLFLFSSLRETTPSSLHNNYCVVLITFLFCFVFLLVYFSPLGFFQCPSEWIIRRLSSEPEMQRRRGKTTTECWIMIVDGYEWI